MNPDATGFQTGRLNKLNRRGPSTGRAGERGFPREFAGGIKRVPADWVKYRRVHARLAEESAYILPNRSVPRGDERTSEVAVAETT